MKKKATSITVAAVILLSISIISSIIVSTSITTITERTAFQISEKPRVVGCIPNYLDIISIHNRRVIVRNPTSEEITNLTLFLGNETVSFNQSIQPGSVQTLEFPLLKFQPDEAIVYGQCLDGFITGSCKKNEKCYRIAPWLSGFNYRRPIIIDNTLNSKKLTDYQINISLDTLSLIAEGKMRSDCGDIRFTDKDGITLLNYWIESGCNTTNTKIWIKISQIPPSSKTTIYLYYGNPNATSRSNGDSVFVFFDDFDGPELNLSKWDEPYVIYSNPMFPMTNFSWGLDNSVGIRPPSIYFTTIDSGNYGSTGRVGTDSKPISVSTTEQYAIDYWVQGERTGGECSGLEYVLDSSKSIYSRYVYTCSISTGTYVFTPPTETIYIRLVTWDTQAGFTFTSWHDYVRLRKYTSPQLTYSIGAEES